MRALVIGGGIAGPVVAIALQQAGIESAIFEAYERSAGLEVGAYLTIAVNGLDALRALELAEPVKAAGFPTSSIEFFSGSGRPLGLVPIGGTLADGTVTHSIKRSDLYQLLHDHAVARGVAIEHRKRLVAAEAGRDDGVIARFDDGSSASGDVLIGADGIHSAVLYRMIFGRRCFFGYTVSPSGEIWWFGNPPSKQPLSPDELRQTTSAQWQQRLIDLYSADAGPAVEIVRATTNEIAGTNQYEMPRVATWHRDRMIIVGDAAHAASPTSGQGASIAIEDGVEIAKALGDNPDPAHAFHVYEQRRRERVERVVAFGAERNAGKMPGLVGRRFRDLVLPTILERHSSPEAMGELSWLFDHHIEWHDASVYASGVTQELHLREDQ